MKTELNQACAKTGFYAPHAMACQTVADRANCIILFREPGVMAQGLIAENYCMKGFRIDTKSCNWGPMSGFVCVDPRLTKDSVYEARNKNWTQEALSGHIVEKFFGKVEDKDWVADVMPIAISKTRIDELRGKGVIEPKAAPNGEFTGISRAVKGDTVLYWRLVPVGNATNSWLKVGGQVPGGYYVLCVDKKGSQAFRQQYPAGAAPILFRGNETILGLINPGTKPRGFKACVTADYDLFAIWEATGSGDRLSLQHSLSSELSKKFGDGNAPLPGGVARMGTVDQRLQSAGHREHHRFGDVSARVMNVKVMLNTALQSTGGYQGGNAIHHNDEAGNFALAKGTLNDCLPLIGFMPGPSTVLVENLGDFKELAMYARERGFHVRAKPDWLQSAGVSV
jgi:Anthrax toxin LF subunit